MCGNMFYLNIWLTVNDSKDIDTVRDRLAECRAGVLLEAGIVRFEVYHSEADPKVFMLNEWWESKAAWETHRSGRVITEIYIPKVLTLATRVPHPSQLVV